MMRLAGLALRAPSGTGDLVDIAIALNPDTMYSTPSMQYFVCQDTTISSIDQDGVAEYLQRPGAQVLAAFYDYEAGVHSSRNNNRTCVGLMSRSIHADRCFVANVQIYRCGIRNSSGRTTGKGPRCHHRTRVQARRPDPTNARGTNLAAKIAHCRRRCH